MPARNYVSQHNSQTDVDAPGYPGVKDVQAQAGGTVNTIILNVSASSTDNVYIGSYLAITAGTAAGDAVEIIEYDGASRTATVEPDFSTPPDATTTYTLYGVPGVMDAVAADSFTLDAGASTVDGFYVSCRVQVHTGAAKGEQRLITSYNGTTRVARLAYPWTHPPSPGDVYNIQGEGGVLAGAGPNTAVLPVTAHGATVTDYYVGLVVEILDATDLSAVRQTRRVTAYDDLTRTATLDAPWATVPVTGDVYRIFGGWSGSFERVYDYSMVNVHIAAESDEHGAYEIWSSQTPTGLNASGVSVQTHNSSRWGNRSTGARVGDGDYAQAIGAEYCRVVIMVYSHRFRGGIQSIFSTQRNQLATRTLAEQIGADSHCLLGRTVIAAQLARSEQFRNLTATPLGELLVDIPRTAFDDLRTAPLTPQIQLNFVSEVGSQELVTSFAGAQSTVRHEVSQYYLRIGDSPIVPSVTPGDYAAMHTKRIGRYRAGLGSLARYTCTFDPLDNAIWQAAGPATSGNALEFGYSTDWSAPGTPVKFGVNRGVGGRPEVRTLQVTGLASPGTLTLTLPNFPVAPVLGGTSGAGGTTVFSVVLDGGETLAEIARKIVEAPTGGAAVWAAAHWDLQNIGPLVIFRSIGVGARDSNTYNFDGGATNVTTTSIQQVQEGIQATAVEKRELTVASGATADSFSLQIVLNGGAANVISLPLAATYDTSEKVAWAIVNAPTTPWASYGFGWKAEIIGAQRDTVRFTALTTGARVGTYSASGGSTGVVFDTYQQRQQGTPRVDHWVFQEDWNIDRCDGTGFSEFLLNPQNGNVYGIAFQYLGFGGITFMVENPATATLMPVHRIEYAGSSAATHLENPHMPLQASILSIGPADQRTHALSISSWSFFTEGPVVHIAPRYAVTSNQLTSGSGVEQAILFLKHPEVFNSGPSQIGVFLRNVTFGMNAAANSVTTVFLRVNPVLATNSGAPAWHTIQYPDTPMLAATHKTNGDPFTTTTAMTVAGGTLVAAQSSTGDTSGILELSDLELDRGDILCVSVRPESGSVDIRATVNWVEDH